MVGLGRGIVSANIQTGLCEHTEKRLQLQRKKLTIYTVQATFEAKLHLVTFMNVWIGAKLDRDVITAVLRKEVSMLIICG